MIVVIDYSVGNVKSVCNAFRHLGCHVALSRDPDTIHRASGLVLPGVAAFGYAIQALGSAADLVRQAAAAGKPLLGICVGFQMLFDESCEYGRHKGLGLIAGSVVALPAGLTIPHMGWNLVNLADNMDLFAGMERQAHFYFAHSYYADVKDAAAKIAYTEYGREIPAAVQKANIYGVQFHPEKSGPRGLHILANFARIAQAGLLHPTKPPMPEQPC